MGDQRTVPEPCIPQRPMQRRINGPLSREGLAGARESERMRMEWDEYYITADEARRIPPEAHTPELIARITYSQRDWPENRMSLAAAIGPVSPGEGETYTMNGMDAGEMFWTPPPDLPPVEHQMPGRRGIDRGER
jgi:hypothetical protein